MNIIMITCSKASDPRVHKEATTLAEEGHRVGVLCFESSITVESENVRFYNFPFLESTFPSPLNWLVDYTLYAVYIATIIPYLFIKERIQAVHIFSPPDFPLPFLYFYKKLFRLLLILDVRDPAPLLAQSRLQLSDTAFIVRFLDLFLKLGIKCADVVITISAPVAYIIGKHGKNPIIIPNSPRDEFFLSYDSMDAMNTGNKVIYVGAMVPKRGLDILINSIGIVKANIPNVELMMVGEGEILAALKTHTVKRELSSNVCFTGYIPYSSIPDYIRSADVAVVPLEPCPINNLGSPNKLYEYMALGKPVLCIDLPGPRSIADGAALFVDFSTEAIAKGLIRLLSNENFAHSLGQKARQIAMERYRWEPVSKLLLDIYENK